MARSSRSSSVAGQERLHRELLHGTLHHVEARGQPVPAGLGGDHHRLQLSGPGLQLRATGVEGGPARLGIAVGGVQAAVALGRPVERRAADGDLSQLERGVGESGQIGRRRGQRGRVGCGGGSGAFGIGGWHARQAGQPEHCGGEGGGGAGASSGGVGARSHQRDGVGRSRDVGGGGECGWPVCPGRARKGSRCHAGAMSDRVSISIDNGIADVRLNRPDKLNALDQAMFQGIAEAGEGLKGDRSVRVVVLSGEGRGFCAGLDFGSFQAMAGDDAADAGALGTIGETSGRITHLAQQTAWVWQEIEVPVVAALHGAVLGGGLQIALGADIRIVAPDAKLSVLESRWGLIPDMTGTVMLPKLVGLDVAKELTLTGRMVSGEEAVQLGLATRLADDPREAALALAAELVTKSPDALREGKRLLNLSGTRPLAEQLHDERVTMGSLIGSPNQVEATTAFFEKRPPSFS